MEEVINKGLSPHGQGFRLLPQLSPCKTEEAMERNLFSKRAIREELSFHGLFGQEKKKVRKEEKLVETEELFFGGKNSKILKDN